MTAVAELRESDVLVGATKGGHPSAYKVWTITWCGPFGAESSGVWYRSREQAAAMAKDCGAKEIEFPAVAP